MRGKTSWLAIAVTAVAVWAVSTRLDHAQSTSPPASNAPVGVVNLVRVFNEFDQTQTLNQKMQEETNRVKLDADKRMQEIQAEEAALQAFTPDSADYYKRSQKLKRMRLEQKVELALEQDRIGEAYLHWVKQTYRMVSEEIAQVARSRGIAVVVTEDEVDTSVTDPKLLQQLILNRKVIYSDPQVDMTDEVLSNLNAAFAKAGGPASVKFTR